MRGLLRLLAKTTAHLWQQRPADATAIHLHHIDLGFEPIRQEIVTRLGQTAYVPAILADISGTAGSPSLAEEIDAEHHAGLPPYAAYVARTIFIHTLAFNTDLRGLKPAELRHSVLGPVLDITFVEEARRRFVAESAYLDDRPGAPIRFQAEANLTQVIRREERNVDAEEVRTQLNDRIREVFGDRTGTAPGTFEAVCFPGGPYDVADDIGDGRPKLVVLSYDAESIGAEVEVPSLIARIFRHKGAEGQALRTLRNNAVFVTADEGRKEEMRGKMARRLALAELKKPDRIAEFAEHQQAKVRELDANSEHELAICIQQCYRHVFYPSRHRIGNADVDLAHTAIDVHSASDKPGEGQRQIVRTLRDLNELRAPEDEPLSPQYVRDRTPLKKGEMTTFALRDEFRRDPGLPLLVGDGNFVKGVRLGIETGEYIYQRGDLLYGPGDPAATIKIDEQSIVFTKAYAGEKGIWPRTATGKTDPDVTEPVAPTPTPAISEVAEPYSLTTEGVLREAFVKLWEKAHGRKLDAIGNLTIRPFETADAFLLVASVGAVAGAEKTVVFEGSYETTEGGTFKFNFRGPVSDATLVKEFLEPQLRSAKETSFEARFDLAFPGGLDTKDAAEKLAVQLCRFATGEAELLATPVAARQADSDGGG